VLRGFGFAWYEARQWRECSSQEVHQYLSWTIQALLPINNCFPKELNVLTVLAASSLLMQPQRYCYCYLLQYDLLSTQTARSPVKKQKIEDGRMGLDEGWDEMRRQKLARRRGKNYLLTYIPIQRRKQEENGSTVGDGGHQNQWINLISTPQMTWTLRNNRSQIYSSHNSWRHQYYEVIHLLSQLVWLIIVKSVKFYLLLYHYSLLQSSLSHYRKLMIIIRTRHQMEKSEMDALGMVNSSMIQ
jgi:hypothetical protein